MHDTADAVVIGAGSTGASIAFHLAARGLAVALIERGQIASGPTGASPAILRQNYAHPTLARLAREGLRTFQRWGDEVGGDCRFVQTGFATGVTAADLPALAATVALQRSLGIAIDLLSPEEFGQLAPDAALDGLAGAAHEPGAGYCDPRAATAALVAAATRSGAVVRGGVAVHEIRVRGGRVAGVETSQGPIDAPVVVNAAGPWARRLARTSGGTELPIVVTRHCVVRVALPRPSRWPALMAYAERGRFYLRPASDEHCLVGSLDHAVDSREVSPDDFARDVDDPTCARFAARAALRFGRLAGAATLGGWASVFDDTPDGNPLIGADPRVRGSFIAAGLSGHGFKLCPVFGRGIADLVTLGHTELPFGDLAVDRFDAPSRGPDTGTGGAQ